MADDQVNTPADTQAVETQAVETHAVERQSVEPQSVEPIRAPEVDEEEEEEEVVNTISHMVPSHQELAVVYIRRFGLHTLLFLQVVWNILSRAANVTQTVSSGVFRSFQNQLYVFFQGSTYPYRIHDYTLVGPGIAPVEWYYNADYKVFISANLYNTSNEYQSHHFQWLSGDIQFNGLSLYDVTEFLQQLKWAGSTRPSTAHVLSAWALHSGIVLNVREGLVLKTINEDGTESCLSLRV